jgi:hypothetical protein
MKRLARETIVANKDLRIRVAVERDALAHVGWRLVEIDGDYVGSIYQTRVKSSTCHCSKSSAVLTNASRQSGF